jgi:histone demethylase
MLCRANEVHVRLGLMFKMKKEFVNSLKHFSLAKSDSSPCTFSPLEIRFHTAHLYEVCCQHEEATAQYSSLLAETSLPKQLQADIYRQVSKFTLK